MTSTTAKGSDAQWQRTMGALHDSMAALREAVGPLIRTREVAKTLEVTGGVVIAVSIALLVGIVAWNTDDLALVVLFCSGLAFGAGCLALSAVMKALAVKTEPSLKLGVRRDIRVVSSYRLRGAIRHFFADHGRWPLLHELAGSAELVPVGNAVFTFVGFQREDNGDDGPDAVAEDEAREEAMVRALFTSLAPNDLTPEEPKVKTPWLWIDGLCCESAFPRARGESRVEPLDGSDGGGLSEGEETKTEIDIGVDIDMPALMDASLELVKVMLEAKTSLVFGFDAAGFVKSPRNAIVAAIASAASGARSFRIVETGPDSDVALPVQVPLKNLRLAVEPSDKPALALLNALAMGLRQDLRRVRSDLLLSSRILRLGDRIHREQTTKAHLDDEARSYLASPSRAGSSSESVSRDKSANMVVAAPARLSRGEPAPSL